MQESLPRAQQRDDVCLGSGQLLSVELDEVEVAVGEVFGDDLAPARGGSARQHLLRGEFGNFSQQLLLLLLRGFPGIDQLLNLRWKLPKVGGAERGSVGEDLEILMRNAQGATPQRNSTRIPVLDFFHLAELNIADLPVVFT